MKKYAVFVAGLAVFCFIFASAALAEKDKAAAGKHGECKKFTGKCPECKEITTKINTTKDELKSLHDQIKALQEAEKAKREAERKAKLEELKQKDPKKYEEVMARHEEMKKKHAGMKKGHHKDKDFNKDEWLKHLKEKNPEMYQLMLQKDNLHEQLKGYHKELADCKKTHTPEHHKEGHKKESKDTKETKDKN